MIWKFSEISNIYIYGNFDDIYVSGFIFINSPLIQSVDAEIF